MKDSIFLIALGFFITILTTIAIIVVKLDINPIVYILSLGILTFVFIIFLILGEEKWKYISQI